MVLCNNHCYIIKPQIFSPLVVQRTIIHDVLEQLNGTISFIFCAPIILRHLPTLFLWLHVLGRTVYLSLPHSTTICREGAWVIRYAYFLYTSYDSRPPQLYPCVFANTQLVLWLRVPYVGDSSSHD